MSSIILRLFYCHPNCSSSSTSNDHRRPLSSSSVPPVYINEVGNDVAAKSVNIALNYVKKTPSLGLSVDMVTVEGNRTDSKGMLEASE